MKSIRVDDDVFAGLQEHAEPLVDTPNDVLRRLLGLPSRRAVRNQAVLDYMNQAMDRATEAVQGRRLRSDANGFGEDERYLRDRLATLHLDGKVWKRSGARSPRGADLNQIQTWIAEVVGARNPENAVLIQRLRDGSTREDLANVTVTVSPVTVDDVLGPPDPDHNEQKEPWPA